MARAAYKCILPEINVKHGNIKYKNTIFEDSCAEFITNYPEKEITLKIPYRIFEINIFENIPEEKGERIISVIKWWWNFLKSNLNFQFLNVIGFEDNILLLTVNNIEEKREKYRKVLYKQALLEFSLLRYAWANPYYLAVYHIKNIENIIDKNIDFIQLLFFYTHLLEYYFYEVYEEGYDEDEDTDDWSDYFSLLDGITENNPIFLWNKSQLNELMGFRDELFYFTIFHLLEDRDNLIKSKKVVVKGFDVENDHDPITFKQLFYNIDNTSVETSVKIYKNSIKYIKEHELNK